jgi:hypothetical protein
MVFFVFLASDSDTIDNVSNSNIPQPPSSSTKPNNIRRQPIRISSEQSSSLTESMTYRTKKKRFFI